VAARPPLFAPLMARAEPKGGVGSKISTEPLRVACSFSLEEEEYASH
jgi:hypothetical protein